jgi:Transcriptional Coactivator p15 (PC4)
MDATRLQELISRRDEIARQAEALAATPEADRPSKPTALKAWQRDLAELQALVAQFNALIEKGAAARVKQLPRVGLEPVAAQAPDSQPDEGVTVARVRKGRNAEIRVTVKPWQGRRVVDVRVWFTREGQDQEMRPSGKGMAFDSAKLSEVIDALIQAKQHV